MKNVILTGDRPTGKLHLGHFVGSLTQRVMLQNSGKFEEIYIEIADAQATTDNADNIEKIRQNIIEVALDYLACGIDPKKSTIFLQSQIPLAGTVLPPAALLHPSGRFYLPAFLLLKFCTFYSS